MAAFFQAMKYGAIAATAAALLLGMPKPADAQSTGSVRFTVAGAGFIIGGSSGTGTLRFKGRTYPLRIGGLSAGTIGVSSADFVGTASNLRSAQDIVGTYSAVGAGVAVVGGVVWFVAQPSPPPPVVEPVVPVKVEPVKPPVAEPKPEVVDAGVPESVDAGVVAPPPPPPRKKPPPVVKDQRGFPLAASRAAM